MKNRRHLTELWNRTVKQNKAFFTLTYWLIQLDFSHLDTALWSEKWERAQRKSTGINIKLILQSWYEIFDTSVLLLTQYFFCWRLHVATEGQFQHHSSFKTHYVYLCHYPKVCLFSALITPSGIWLNVEWCICVLSPQTETVQSIECAHIMEEKALADR